MEARIKKYEQLITEAHDLAERVEDFFATAHGPQRQMQHDKYARGAFWEAVKLLVQSKRMYEKELKTVDAVVSRIMTGAATVEDAYYVEAQLKESRGE